MNNTVLALLLYILNAIKKALNAVHPHSKADPYPDVIKIKFLEMIHLGFNFDSVKD